MFLKRKRVYAKILLVAVSVMWCKYSMAQQDAMFTHYMFNTLAVNPAYAGSRDALTVTALHRSQWVGFEGAPQTQTLTMHTPIFNKKLGIGLSVLNDKIGPLKSTTTYIDFSYTLKIDDKSKLAFGLKGGGSIFQAKFTSLELDEADDNNFQENISSKLLPNFGFGMYYHRERFYAGVSTPKLLENGLKADKQNPIVTSIEKRHYFFIMGAVTRLSSDVEFKPTTFVKVTDGAPLEVDLTGSFIIKNQLLLGAGYRTGDAVSALLGYHINNRLYAGYSFDWSFGIATSKYNAGSHEIMIRYDFFYNDKEKILSPRYF
jgi:type IX secretion system PorP/SprF family membrane protein